jgi:hypothetical protein
MHIRILLLSLTILLTAGLTAQNTTERVKKRAKNRTEARANQRLDQKVDEGVDKAFNAIEGLFGKKKKKKAADTTAAPTERVEDGGLRANDGDAYADEEEATSAIMNALGMGGGDWEPYTNPVTFSLTMETTEIKKNGKEETVRMRMGALPTEFAMVVQGEGSERNRMILNTQDGKTTMIATDKKGKTEGYRIRMPNFSSTVAEAQEEMMDYLTFTATGERRTIEGYDCEKIIVTDSKHNTTTESWVTQDIDLSTAEVFGGITGMAGAGKQQMPVPENLPAVYAGFPVESTTTDGKTTTIMRMTDIRIGEGNIDRSLFDTGGVRVQEVGF